jgi:hypothetical protein
MTTVDLVHPRETVKVSTQALVLQSNVFADGSGLAAFPYALRSSVSVSDFRRFVSALEGNAVAIAIKNIGGLSLLCEEFGFGDLAVKVSEFQEIGYSTEAAQERPVEVSTVAYANSAYFLVVHQGYPGELVRRASFSEERSDKESLRLDFSHGSCSTHVTRLLDILRGKERETRTIIGSYFTLYVLHERMGDSEIKEFVGKLSDLAIGIEKS